MFKAFRAGQVVPLKQHFRKRFGFTPLGVFLVATLAMAAWLGYQALDAAASHRRTAESVLRDYALISATEMADVASDRLEDVLDEIFDDVAEDLEDAGERDRDDNDDRPRRREPPQLPSADAVRRRISEAMWDEAECEDPCRGFRNPMAVFRVNQQTLEAVFSPDTLNPGTRAAIVETVRGWTTESDASELGLITSAAGRLAAQPLSLGYLVWGGSAALPPAVYGLVVPTTAVGELMKVWYEDRELLPEPMDGGQPNDSMLYVTVRTNNGSVVFASSIEYPGELSATQNLDPEFGGLVVQAAIRPDAAAQLIIGGLPRSRLPLLATLLLLTLGVGVAAVVQLRRERTFQRLREDFVSGVSHELRTPLAQIRMFAELQEGGKLRTDDDRRRATSVINREARRLSHLVENILQFSKLRHTAGLGMPSEELDFADALAEGLDAVTPLLEDRGMKLQVSAQPGLLVLANRDALTRIVVNLLDNAVKYGKPGQTVKVGVSRVNGSARLSVADQGPGVPIGDRDGIFKAYRRLERDVETQVPGTGIGLSVVSELAALHHGRTWVDDADGGGARFVVELPLAWSEANEKYDEHARA